jgi:uncharacterized protein with FMN-binding domain
MKCRRDLLLKSGTVFGIGALASVLPSQVGLSTAYASPNVETKIQIQSAALVTHSMTLHSKKAVKAKKVVKKKRKVVKKVASAKTTGKSGAYVGQVAQTQFGPVEVKVIVSQGRITKVATPIYPTGTFRDKEINSQAIPMLEQEVIRVQSSNIQGVGGASYTSQGFYTSLVSALAKAGHK